MIIFIEDYGVTLPKFIGKYCRLPVPPFFRGELLNFGGGGYFDVFLPRRNNGSRLSWFSRCRFDESTPIFTVDDKRPLDVDSKHVGKTYSSKKIPSSPKSTVYVGIPNHLRCWGMSGLSCKGMLGFS